MSDTVIIHGNNIMIEYKGEAFPLPLELHKQIVNTIATEIYYIAQGTCNGHHTAKIIREEYGLEGLK